MAARLAGDSAAAEAAAAAFDASLDAGTALAGAAAVLLLRRYVAMKAAK